MIMLRLFLPYLTDMALPKVPKKYFFICCIFLSGISFALFGLVTPQVLVVSSNISRTCSDWSYNSPCYLNLFWIQYWRMCCLREYHLCGVSWWRQHTGILVISTQYHPCLGHHRPHVPPDRSLDTTSPTYSGIPEVCILLQYCYLLLATVLSYPRDATGDYKYSFLGLACTELVATVVWTLEPFLRQYGAQDGEHTGVSQAKQISIAEGQANKSFDKCESE